MRFREQALEGEDGVTGQNPVTAAHHVIWPAQPHVIDRVGPIERLEPLETIERLEPLETIERAAWPQPGIESVEALEALEWVEPVDSI